MLGAPPATIDGIPVENCVPAVVGSTPVVPNRASSVSVSVAVPITPQYVALTVTLPPWVPPQLKTLPAKVPRVASERARKLIDVTSAVGIAANCAMTVYAWGEG